jgi:hypothetical protein
MSQAPVYAPPPPPQGPGVIPPFPAPPTEGRRRRIGLGLGIGAGLLMLICGGGLAAAIGLFSVAGRALNEQAQVVVTDYLDDVRAERYSEAYDALCDQTRARVTESQFTSDARTAEPIERFDVGEMDLTTVDLNVPVTVTYSDGRSAQLKAYLGQDRETGRFQVCSVEE